MSSPGQIESYSVRLQPYLAELISRISSEEDYDFVEKLIKRLINELEEMNKKRRRLQPTETSMLGEMQGSGKQEKRRKYDRENKR